MGWSEPMVGVGPMILEADVGVADLSFEFGARSQGGDGVHHDDIEGIGADELVGNGERFFAGIGLGDDGGCGGNV